MGDKILKLWGKGPLKINDFETVAYVLEDGSALLSKTKMFEAIGMQRKGSTRSDSPGFIGAINLQQFINPELKEQLNGKEFYDGSKIISAYPAEILYSVCQVYLEARRANALKPSQLPIAESCEILLMAFSKVGITALIYEQLGFEKFKHPEAFRLLVESYLSEEIRKWTKEFPDEFFWQMDRIFGREKTTSRNRPLFYAGFIRKYVYDPIKNGLVLKKLDEKIPKDSHGRKKNRLHSAASEDIGISAIRSQIYQILGVLKVSSNKRKFQENYNRLLGKPYQLDLWEY